MANYEQKQESETEELPLCIAVSVFLGPLLYVLPKL